MLLLAVGLMAATAYLLVWVVNCWTNCKSSRMLPLVLSQEPEDQSVWRLSYEIFIGLYTTMRYINWHFTYLLTYRFDSGSLSKQLFWRTSASKARLHSTYGNIVSRCHLSSAASVDPHTLVDWLFHEPGRNTATAVSPYRDLGHGTVFLLTFEPQTFQSKHSDINWRHFCLQCDCRFSALAALRDFAL